MPDKPGLLIGYKGVKYGLQRRQKPAAPKPAAFADESSDEEAVETQIAKLQEQKLKAKKVEAARVAALAEDETVFEYDSVYDDIQQSRETSKRKEVQQRKPKYIQALLQKAEIRKKEQDLAYERRMLKEREQDDHLFTDKEAFLTTAYKKKLVEDKYWIEREKIMDIVEAAEDVTKKSDLTGFYSNLVTKNVSFASNRLASPDSKPSSKEPTIPVPPQNFLPDPLPQSTAQPAKSEPINLPSEAHTTLPSTPAEDKEPKEETKQSKKRHDEGSISSARERYLQRKKLKMVNPDISL